jgi:hypothetical protein
MPINAFNPNPSNRLAYPDSIGPVPRNEYLGALADFLAKSYSPERTQQMQGVAEFLSLPAISRTVDMLSYGEPLTTGAGGLGGTIRPKADVVEAGLAVAPLTPAAALQAARVARQAALAGGRVVGGAINEAMVYGRGPLASITPQPMFAVPPFSGKATSALPQENALKLAQQRAALPVDQGGLGLKPNNTADERAAAMGFDTPALHGSGTPNIQAFDPNLVGTKAGNAFDNYMWSTSSPEAASGYSLNTNQFASIPEVKTLNEKINQLGKDISSAFSNKKMDEMGNLRKELSNVMKQKSDLYKEFETGKFLSEGSTIYPVLLKGDEFMPYEAGGQSWMRANRPAIEESQARGFQGVAIRNVKDNPNPSVNDIIANTYATENPDLFRSRFAAFDPFRRSAAIAASMGVAAPDLLAQDKNQLRKNR